MPFHWFDNVPICLFAFQKIEDRIEDASSAGKLREALKLEQVMENEILKTALREVFFTPAEARDLKLIKQLLQRDSTAVKVISERLEHSSPLELSAISEKSKRSKRQADLLSGVLGSSSGGVSTFIYFPKELIMTVLTVSKILVKT